MKRGSRRQRKAPTGHVRSGSPKGRREARGRTKAAGGDSDKDEIEQATENFCSGELVGYKEYDSGRLWPGLAFRSLHDWRNYGSKTSRLALSELAPNHALFLRLPSGRCDVVSLPLHELRPLSLEEVNEALTEAAQAEPRSEEHIDALRLAARAPLIPTHGDGGGSISSSSSGSSRGNSGGGGLRGGRVTVNGGKPQQPKALHARQEVTIKRKRRSGDPTADYASSDPAPAVESQGRPRTKRARVNALPWNAGTSAIKGDAVKAAIAAAVNAGDAVARKPLFDGALVVEGTRMRRQPKRMNAGDPAPSSGDARGAGGSQGGKEGGKKRTRSPRVSQQGGSNSGCSSEDSDGGTSGGSSDRCKGGSTDRGEVSSNRQQRTTKAEIDEAVAAAAEQEGAGSRENGVTGGRRRAGARQPALKRERTKKAAGDGETGTVNAEPASQDGAAAAAARDGRAAVTPPNRRVRKASFGRTPSDTRLAAALAEPAVTADVAVAATAVPFLTAGSEVAAAAAAGAAVVAAAASGPAAASALDTCTTPEPAGTAEPASTAPMPARLNGNVARHAGRTAVAAARKATAEAATAQVDANAVVQPQGGDAAAPVLRHRRSLTSAAASVEAAAVAAAAAAPVSPRGKGVLPPAAIACAGATVAKKAALVSCGVGGSSSDGAGARKGKRPQQATSAAVRQSDGSGVAAADAISDGAEREAGKASSASSARPKGKGKGRPAAPPASSPSTLPSTATAAPRLATPAKRLPSRAALDDYEKQVAAILEGPIQGNTPLADEWREEADRLAAAAAAPVAAAEDVDARAAAAAAAAWANGASAASGSHGLSVLGNGTLLGASLVWDTSRFHLGPPDSSDPHANAGNGGGESSGGGVKADADKSELQRKSRSARVAKAGNKDAIVQQLAAGTVKDHSLVAPPCYATPMEAAASTRKEKLEEQPFAVFVHPSVSFTCDLHAHLSDAEVIGLLAGWYDADARRLYIQAAFPCLSTDRADDGTTDVEMDSVAQVEINDIIGRLGLKVVGWYHSHPTFQPDPSKIDIENHANLQQLYEQDDHSTRFVGLIVGTYASPTASSILQFFHVKREVCRGRSVAYPMRLNAQFPTSRLAAEGALAPPAVATAAAAAAAAGGLGRAGIRANKAAGGDAASYCPATAPPAAAIAGPAPAADGAATATSVEDRRRIREEHLQLAARWDAARQSWRDGARITAGLDPQPWRAKSRKGKATRAGGKASPAKVTGDATLAGPLALAAAQFIACGQQPPLPPAPGSFSVPGSSPVSGAFPAAGTIPITALGLPASLLPPAETVEPAPHGLQDIVGTGDLSSLPLPATPSAGAGVSSALAAPADLSSALMNAAQDMLTVAACNRAAEAGAPARAGSTIDTCVHNRDVEGKNAAASRAAAAAVPPCQPALAAAAAVAIAAAAAAAAAGAAGLQRLGSRSLVVSLDGVQSGNYRFGVGKMEAAAARDRVPAMPPQYFLTEAAAATKGKELVGEKAAGTIMADFATTIDSRDFGAAAMPDAGAGHSKKSTSHSHNGVASADKTARDRRQESAEDCVGDPGLGGVGTAASLGGASHRLDDPGSDGSARTPDGGAPHGATSNGNGDNIDAGSTPGDGHLWGPPPSATDPRGGPPPAFIEEQQEQLLLQQEEQPSELDDGAAAAAGEAAPEERESAMEGSEEDTENWEVAVEPASATPARAAVPAGAAAASVGAMQRAERDATAVEAAAALAAAAAAAFSPRWIVLGDEEADDRFTSKAAASSAYPTLAAERKVFLEDVDAAAWQTAELAAATTAGLRDSTGAAAPGGDGSAAAAKLAAVAAATAAAAAAEEAAAAEAAADEVRAEHEATSVDMGQTEACSEDASSRISSSEAATLYTLYSTPFESAAESSSLRAAAHCREKDVEAGIIIAGDDAAAHTAPTSAIRSLNRESQPGGTFDGGSSSGNGAAAAAAAAGLVALASTTLPPLMASPRALPEATAPQAQKSLPPLAPMPILPFGSGPAGDVVAVAAQQAISMEIAAMAAQLAEGLADHAGTDCGSCSSSGGGEMRMQKASLVSAVAAGTLALMCDTREEGMGLVQNGIASKTTPPPALPPQSQPAAASSSWSGRSGNGSVHGMAPGPAHSKYFTSSSSGSMGGRIQRPCDQASAVMPAAAASAEAGAVQAAMPAATLAARQAAPAAVTAAPAALPAMLWSPPTWPTPFAVPTAAAAGGAPREGIVAAAGSANGAAAAASAAMLQAGEDGQPPRPWPLLMTSQPETADALHNALALQILNEPQALDRELWPVLRDGYGPEAAVVSFAARRLAAYYSRYSRRIDLASDWKEGLMKGEKLARALEVWLPALELHPPDRLPFLRDVMQLLASWWGAAVTARLVSGGGSSKGGSRMKACDHTSAAAAASPKPSRSQAVAAAAAAAAAAGAASTDSDGDGGDDEKDGEFEPNQKRQSKRRTRK